MNFEKKKYLPSYGRKKGRVIRDKKQKLLDNLLPQIRVQSTESRVQNVESGPQQDSALRTLDSTLWLEIGFGSGEHLAHRAGQNRNVNFIGCEVYQHGIGNFLKSVEEKKLKNVRIFTEDARLLLEQLPENSIDRIFILFPDPWPKLRHHKRRIINQDTLKLLHKILKPEGKLNIATDWPNYAQWIMIRITNHGGFEFMANSPNDWKNPPEDHITTKYQAKAQRESRTPVFLNFAKID